jgi:bifunctional DNA-binding transcriptional regulator/antitoxin component of YhaV-PrlF toxin-antitoxin module
MTTTVTAKGAVRLPRKVLKQHRVRAGDKFEITATPDDPGVIELRRVPRTPNEGLVELLRACPVKGFPLPERNQEPPRDFDL